MPFLPAQFRHRGQPTQQEVERQADQRRGSARARGYTTKWEKAASGHLAHEPLCVYCAMGAWGEPPRDEAATLVDHLIPHRGDQAIFWRRADWISCCTDCHAGPKQQLERRPAALAVFANDVRRFRAARRGGGVKV